MEGETVEQGFIQKGGISPPQQESPPPQNLLVAIFGGIFTSYLVATFQPFWSPRSNLRACKFHKFPGEAYTPTPPRGRGFTCIIFPTPTIKFCMKPS